MLAKHPSGFAGHTSARPLPRGRRRASCAPTIHAGLFSRESRKYSEIPYVAGAFPCESDIGGGESGGEASGRSGRGCGARAVRWRAQQRARRPFRGQHRPAKRVSPTIPRATSACEAADPEFLAKSGWPCALLLHLRFRGKRYDFAAPFRPNIPPNTPTNQFFLLLPRPATKPKHHHGIHYLKMFPINRQNRRRFRTKSNHYCEVLQQYVDDHAPAIVARAQRYLDSYELFGPEPFAVDSDKLIEIMVPKGSGHRATTEAP